MTVHSRPILAILILSLSSCTPAHPPPIQQDPTLVIDAYRQGIADAIAELRNNSPTIYALTTPTTEVDPETNLPYHLLQQGPLTTLQLWRLLGHNDFIRGYLGTPLGPPVPH